MIIGTVCLMVLALGLLARVISTNDQRGRELANDLLDRTLTVQNQRLRTITNIFIWKLDEEAQRMQRMWPTSDSTLLFRWLPILETQAAVSSIGLADDRGNEWSLSFNNGSWKYLVTRREGNEVTAMVQEWKNPQRPGLSVPSTERGIDPRATTWFGRALDNRKGRAVWTESEDPDKEPFLHLSRSLRTDADPDNLMVICFELDAGYMLANDMQRGDDIRNVVFNSHWHPLTEADSTQPDRLWSAIVEGHRQNATVAPFEFESGGLRWLGHIIPLQLNGTTLYSGSAVELSGIEHWSGKHNMGLWFILVLLILLSLLLTLIFVQGRSAERLVKHQQKRSSVQARHLARAIEEREVLDREVHHRVKNNLQVVSSLLNLQAQRIPDEAARKEFMRGKRRIDSMALVHHKLYRQTDLSAVDLAVFIDDITKAMAAMFEPDSRTVGHSVDTGGIRSDADTSIQLGMILCELLANCYQHAFPSPIGGHIQIRVSALEDGSYKLTVKDNGRGFTPESVKEEHLGLEVVEALAGQLDGSYSVSINEGTRVEVIFRMGERL